MSTYICKGDYLLEVCLNQSVQFKKSNLGLYFKPVLHEL